VSLPSTGRPAGPQPRDSDIDVFGLTHPGRVRPDNQDHFLLCTLHRNIRVRATSIPHPEALEVPGERLAYLGMVADGVGGGEGGEEASRVAIEAIATYATGAMNTADPSQHDRLLEDLQRAALESHEQVLAKGRARPELAGLATTLTLGFSVWPSLFVLHLGDSRAYLLREGRLHRLTRDQTLAEDLVDNGVLPAEKVGSSPFAHVLSSAIGSNARPVVARYDSAPEDVVLLCTDGLTRHVPDERIRERLLAMTSAEQAARALLDDALEAGGHDNVTLVLGRARPGTAAAGAAP
jgi:serine/threonine protein phosphatase PrpC